jgi:hypothetical protein
VIINSLKIHKYLFAIVLIVTIVSYPQSKNLTKGADNGYAWNSMSNPLALFDDSKYNYLSGILERYSLLKQNFPEIESLGCGEEVGKLQMEGKSEQISLDDMVTAVDKFYIKTENLIVPVVFAYCYSIKEKSGLTKKQLSNYLNEVMKFCED